MKRDLAKLFAAARSRGWIISRTRGDHWKMRHPPTGAVVFTSATPSCWRAVANATADMARVERRHRDTANA